jgi:citrate lyase subunit beta/citryl-CoA lyase
VRSKLFVPGIRPELFPKAWAGDADALSFDLEDSVPAAGKDEARRNVVDYLRAMAGSPRGKAIIVRTNAPDSAWFEDDVRALAACSIDLLNVPKIEDADALRRAADDVADAGFASAPGLLVNIETPRGLAHAAPIATAHPRVAGLQLGLADLFEPFGIERTPTNVHAAMFAVRMAAAQAGAFALDAAFARIDAPGGFEAEARMARGLGFIGKSCIHPRQVGLANRVFLPTGQEVAWARRVVAAAQEADARGHGAFELEGRMVDAPFVLRARALLHSIDREPGE